MGTGDHNSNIFQLGVNLPDIEDESHDGAVISVKSIFGSFRVAVLRLCHDLPRLALHARDRLERPRRVALIRHRDVDYGAVRVSAGEGRLSVRV